MSQIEALSHSPRVVGTTWTCVHPGSPRVRVCPDDRVPDRVETDPVQPRVLIVDDHDGFRSAARLMLENDAIRVVGEVEDGERAMAAASTLRPDVVLLDIYLPDADGFQVAETLARLPTPPTVVLISSHPIADVRARVARSAAVGFLAKHELSGPALRALVESPWSRPST